MTMADLYIDHVALQFEQETYDNIPHTCDVLGTFERHGDYFAMCLDTIPEARERVDIGVYFLLDLLGKPMPPTLVSVVILNVLFGRRYKEYMIEVKPEMADLLVEKLEGTIKMIDSKKRVFAFIPSATMDVIVSGYGP